jgi:hypothetical protein
MIDIPRHPLTDLPGPCGRRSSLLIHDRTVRSNGRTARTARQLREDRAAARAGEGNSSDQ